MLEKVQKIKLHGLDFILTSPYSKKSPIATIRQYQKGECSYAQLYGEKIIQFGELIGIKSEIEFGDIIEIEVDILQVLEGIMGNTWPPNRQRSLL